MKYIDNGYWQIGRSLASKLAKPGGGLPKSGWQREVEHNGTKYWLCRTFVTDKDGNRSQVWALRENLK